MTGGCLRAQMLVVVVIAVLVALSGCSVGPELAKPDPSAIKARQAAGIADCAAGTEAATPRPDGLPDATLPCLGGDPQVYLPGLAGSRPLVINVWATWCGPCRTEAPILAAVSTEMASQVQFLGIDHVDPDVLGAISFAQAAGWRYPQLADPDGSGAQALKVAGLPQTLFVSSDGRVIYRHSGAFDSNAQLRDLITTHLGVG